MSVQEPHEDPEMELIVVIAVLVGLLILDVLAVTFGVDSRETMRDDWSR
jgi:hypothetical protein